MPSIHANANSYRGLLATRTWLSCSQPLGKLNAQKFSTNPMAVPVEPGLFNLTTLRTQRLLFVRYRYLLLELSCANLPLAKFTGYQYGGRPLGLTFVKYMSAGNGDAMEGAEPTGGITQDQIM